MLAGGDTPSLIVPPLQTPYLHAPISLSLDVLETQPEASSSRQTWTRNWVFRPLVCLGPALRSLAPPFVG
jgi:hypothetical protein